MAEPFLGEIRLFSINFAPKGWALCNGQLMQINMNQALFALLGTTYGGNGQTTFALPDLRGRCANHEGNGHTLGEVGGSESVTLTAQQMPQHVHFQQAGNGNGTGVIPTGQLLGGYTEGYIPPTNLIAMNPGILSNVGGSQPHDNMSPYLVLNFCIALQGIFPSQN